MNDNSITEEQIQENFIDLKNDIPDYIYNDPTNKDLFYAQGRQLGTLKYYIQDLILNCFIETATWSLDILENEYGIVSKADDTFEMRRNRILAKKKGWQTITKEVIKSICNSFVDSTTVVEHNEDYYFDLILENINRGFPNFLNDLMEIIEDLKPAHLDSHYILTATTNSNLYIGCATVDSETISTYPYMPNDIISQTNIYIPIANESNLETVITYPSESISKILYSKLSDSTYKEMQFK